MKNLNRVTLIGHIAADPELRQTPAGKTVLSFALAVNRYLKSTEKSETVDFHRIAVWGKQAESLDKYLAKGMFIYIEGKLINYSYEKEKVKQYKTEIMADSIIILNWEKSKKVADKMEVKQEVDLVSA